MTLQLFSMPSFWQATMHAIFFQRRLPSFSLVLTLGVIFSALTLVNPATRQGIAIGQEAVEEDLRLVRARAIRQAVATVAQSVVWVELIGVAQATGGEVASDAPTVAVAIDDQRHFIASSLVVRGEPTSILLVKADGKRVVATVVARDHARQLVLLRTEADLGVPPLILADVKPVVGQTVIAVGRHSAGQSPAVSTGILSATDRNWGLALQTDARVSSAFYGGPLIDLYGRVLGVIVPMVPDGGAEDETGWYDSGVAFAIAMPDIASRLATMIQGTDIQPGLLGVVAKESDPYVESTEIAAVRPRSPAARAGLQAGDRVQSIHAVTVRSHREIKQVLGGFDAGAAIDMVVKRGDDELKLTAKLAESIPPLLPQRLGITVSRDQQSSGAPGTPGEAALTITGVVQDSPADAVLRQGDRLQSIDGNPIDDIDSLRRRILATDPEAPVKITVIRDDKPLEVSVTTASITALDAKNFPDSLLFGKQDEKKDTVPWAATDFDMPDISNSAALLAPPEKTAPPEKDAAKKKGAGKTEETAAESKKLGLMIVMVDPGQEDLKLTLSKWSDAAAAKGVIVCAISPAQADRWTPEEIDVPQRIAAALRQRYEIDPAMQVIAGEGKGPGGSIALAAAILRPGTFSGLTVSDAIRPPAIRLRENDPAAPLQLWIQMSESDDDAPGWIGSLEKVGYATLRGGADPAKLLDWVRSLSII